MPSITSWNRIEPRVRGGSLSGVEARVADPLWLLARQWQTGEFRGEDVGSPVTARLEAEVGTLSRYAPGLPTASLTGDPYDPQDAPLEAVVEREPAHLDDEQNFRLAAESGLAFLRELDAQRASHLRGQVLLWYALARRWGSQRDEIDGAGLRLLDVVAGRVPDGLALRAAVEEAFAAGQRLPDQPQLTDPDDQGAFARAIDRWLGWWSDLDAGADPRDPRSWNPGRVEYGFAVSGRLAAGEHALVAPEYDGSGVDWHAFDQRPGLSLGAGGDPPAGSVEQVTLPTSVSYPGMPRRRFWEFEDSDVHLGAVEASREDLTRLLLLEFALIYGNDFFLIPLPLAVGSLCRITSLEITDNFGGRWSIPSVGEVDGPTGRFRLFESSTAVGTAAAPGRPVMLLAPATAGQAAGKPLEEVALMRDEMANLAWAVERTVPGAAGRPLSRHEAFHERRQREYETSPPTTPSQDDPLRYRIMGRPPDHWLPLVPVRVSANRNALQLRALLDDAGDALVPHGRLMQNGGLIEDEEVPREGVSVSRQWQRARWLGGRSWLWCGRRVGVGGGESSSGLRFDVAEPGA